MRSSFLALAVVAATAWAQPAPPAGPAQQYAAIRDLKLESGPPIQCRIGYRTFGALNTERSNAILFPTWFSGKSEDLAGFMGPGKLVDTSKYHVIAVDALANGQSCSPSNTGGALPRVTIRDMVNSQIRLLKDHLGIRKLHAVIGISMGGMQTFEWMVAYPQFMKFAVPIIGSPKLTTADLLLWQAELGAIEAVQKAGGDPRSAMPAVNAMHQFALYTPEWLVENKPASDFPAMQAQFEKDAREGMDPRDFAAQLRAMMGHDISRGFGGSMDAAVKAVKAQVLVVVAPQDHMVNPVPASKLGFRVLQLEGNCGHMAPGCQMDKLKAEVAAFLNQ